MDFLLEVMPQMYHLFPGIGKQGITQEQQMEGLDSTSAGRFNKKYLYQPDGSRFGVLKTSQKQTVRDLLEKFERAGRADILCGPTNNILPVLDHIDLVKTSRFIAYHTHTFYNCVRIIPILYESKSNTVINISTWFPDKIPDDDLGIVIKDLEVATLKELSIYGVNPAVYPYLSTVRMCKHCGIVSDFSKPNKAPWLSYKDKNRYKRMSSSRVDA